MYNPLISVIVPVYKVEPYLERCVNSIRNQTYQNLEIILVDDGSPDRCGEMCDAFAKEDSRIRVIHKENGGLSSARNAGLDAMNGEYVGFVDSDDWIEPGMYLQLYELLSKYKAQISACGLQCDEVSGKVHYFNPDYPKDDKIEIYLKVEAIKELIIAHKITNSVCDKLFKSEIFNGLRFKHNLVNEDFELMPKCLELVKAVVYSPVPFYHYVMTSESITRGEFKESRFTETDISRRHLSYYKEKYPELYCYAAAKHIELGLIIIDNSTGFKKFAEKRRFLIKEIKSFKLFEFLKFLDKKNKLKFLLFKINVNVYLWFMDFYRMCKHD